MSVLVMVFVCSQRNTGGARSSSTRVVGQLSEPSAPMSAVMGSATFPAKSGECDGKRHALVLIGVRDIPGQDDAGAGAPARTSARQHRRGERLAREHNLWCLHGLGGSKQMDTVHGLDATGSLGESEVTFESCNRRRRHVDPHPRRIRGQRPSHAAHRARGTPRTVRDAPRHGVDPPPSRASRRRRRAIGRHCPSAPAAISSGCTAHDTFGGEVVEDAGPMTASSMVTFPDMSSARYSVLPSHS